MEFVGLDTETISGFCRLIGLSTKEHFIVNQSADLQLFIRSQHNNNFLAYNADYDAQAILKWLPSKELDYIMKGIEVDWEGIRFLYYPHKFLKFGSNWLFDVYQYYHAGTLDNAAQKYLGKKKLEVKTKIFTEKTIQQKKTINYCIHDATLCYELFMKMYKTLPKELLETKPISTAYYSAKYFKKELTENRIPFEVNVLARPAYHGGLFTINTRGHFYNLYNYDIVSAYPYEICKLKGMKRFNVVSHKDYIGDAAYGFYHVKVDIEDKFVGPLIYKFKGLCLNPVGKYEGIITKQEYEAVKHYEHEILSAVHIFPSADTPFKERMEKVFHRKCNDENKIVWKFIANSLYGKTAAAQKSYVDRDLFDEKIIDTIEKDGKYYYKIENIDKSNFVYASVITANTRLRMYNEIFKYRENIIAVQTDSLISKIPLPDLQVDEKILGAWKLEKWDEAFMIGSGVYFYRIGNVWKMKFRGFNISGEKVEKILDDLLNSDSTSVSFDVLKRISIQESKRIHDEDMANIILPAVRNLKINFDRKRIWDDDWKSGKEIQTKVISSLAVFIPAFKIL